MAQTGADCLVRWLSVNGEGWGLGPTGVFASAAALSLYHELETAVGRDSLLQRTLLSSMVLGMLALMVHLWVCAMRFVQYYLDTIIKDSPPMLLEVTKATLLGDRAELVPLGSLTRFLRQQQPQIHITLCWFIALCYADFVRKRCYQRFSLPYFEEWQTVLQAQAMRGVQGALRHVNSFVDSVHSRLRTCAPPPAAGVRTCAPSPAAGVRTCAPLPAAGVRTCAPQSTAGVRTLVNEATRTSCKSCEAATSIACAVNESDTLSGEATLQRSRATEAPRTERESISKTNLTIESLRAYIAETRCVCTGGEQTGVSTGACRRDTCSEEN